MGVEKVNDERTMIYRCIGKWVSLFKSILWPFCFCLCKPVVLTVVDIDPQRSVGPSKGSISSHVIEWGSLNGQGVNE